MRFSFLSKKRNRNKSKTSYMGSGADTLEDLDFVVRMGTSIAEQNMPVYTKHLVCFMDVMNYESSVVADKSTFGNIKKLHSEVSTLLSNLPSFGASPRVSLLFNCLAISYNLSERREDLMDIYFALRGISIVAVQLALKGYFVQGGLAFGNLYHDAQKCIGPAIEKAIRCSRKAIYPRIVIDSNFFLEGTDGAILSDISKFRRDYQYLEQMFHCVDVKNLPVEQRWAAKRNPNFVHFLDYLEITLSECPEMIPTLKKNILTGLSKTAGEESRRFLLYAEYFNDIVHNTLGYKEDACINIKE